MSSQILPIKGQLKTKLLNESTIPSNAYQKLNPNPTNALIIPINAICNIFSPIV